MDGRSRPGPRLIGKRVLVTGASGFLGSHLVDRAAREGAIVGALARTEGKLALLERRATVLHLRCDLCDPAETMATVRAFAPHIVFHLAAHPDGTETFDQAHTVVRANVLGTLNLLEAFRLCSGEIFVYGDSCKVYGNGDVPYRSSMPLRPTSSYAIGKVAGWELCQMYWRLYGVATVSVRPTLIYGARQGFNIISYVVRRVLDGAREISIDGGDQTRDPLFVADAMNAFVAIATAGQSLAGAVINIGGQNEIRVIDLARLVLDVMNSPIPVVAEPQRMRPTEIMRSFCDNAEAFELLAWRSETGLRDGLAQTVQPVAEALGALRAVS